MKPLTPRQQTLIVNNVVAACKDIDKLNKTGYNFLYLAQGFIAHYDIWGFKDYYGRLPYGQLANEICYNTAANMWNNFHPGDRDYEYYHSKAVTYARIIDELITIVLD